MSPSRLSRWGGLAGILGGILGILLTPIVAAAGYNWWDKPYGGWSEPVPPLVRPFRFIVEPMLSLPPPDEVYPTYGRGFFFVFLLMLVGLVGLKSWAGESLGRWGKLGFRLGLAGLVLNLFGNLSDYWLGEEVLHQPLWGAFFVIGTLLGYLVYSAGSIILGVATIRRSILPPWSVWGLILAPPLGIVLLFWGIYHIPSGLVLPMSVAWVLLGYALLSRRAETEVAPGGAITS